MITVRRKIIKYLNKNTRKKKWRSPQETSVLVTFTEEILNRKLHVFVQC